MTILDKIIAEKEKEVKELRKKTDQSAPANKKAVAHIADSFRNTDTMNIIAEIKRASPSKGSINAAVNPAEQAQIYESNGAGAISVLTDSTFFKGSMDDVRNVREAVDLPILCKDFFIDTVQIDQAKAAGASVILLIVAALAPDKLRELYDYATNQGLEVLCEVHDAEEMEQAVALDPAIIGINNRNLKTFDVDLATFETLASMVTNPKTVLISESGIKTKEDVIRVQKSGAKGILVGETLMRADNLPAAFQALKIPLPKEGTANAH
ncbi:indole-3-glycerol phosphate synthase TrpC [Virgibacillus siamensis]|uniref:indole-3-glycerol phosphate synthase TrpC n=1 Tax=Virgibacillus siamensis TaxID=480071 RepID=UPI00158F3229|nr:indole-3-glycerol phosphate synthase TrpC [Virgibacillus siamensis]